MPRRLPLFVLLAVLSSACSTLKSGGLDYMVSQQPHGVSGRTWNRCQLDVEELFRKYAADLAGFTEEELACLRHSLLDQCVQRSGWPGYQVDKLDPGVFDVAEYGDEMTKRYRQVCNDLGDESDLDDPGRDIGETQRVRHLWPKMDEDLARKYPRSADQAAGTKRNKCRTW